MNHALRYSALQLSAPTILTPATAILTPATSKKLPSMNLTEATKHIIKKVFQLIL
ncbi:hypothetical protein HanRHA438_Chr15g0698011 [Helianthus annuus]|nr:hypothetical protein HanRHA438_Chr15g0698011 [Helianthus annuus]